MNSAPPSLGPGPTPGIQASDALAGAKQFFRRYPRAYLFAKYVLSPVYFDLSEFRFVRSRIAGGETILLNLGSGNIRLHPSLLNVDLAPQPGVHIVSDCARLPFRDGRAGAVMALSLLEHTDQPEKLVGEVHRVLKPGGWVYADAPFIAGFHAAPHDYTRWTDMGLRKLFGGFDILELRVAGGPTSALLWIAQEWLALLLSLGSTTLYRWWCALLMLVTFPFKVLDALLRRHPMARNIALSFVVIARKSA